MKVDDDEEEEEEEEEEERFKVNIYLYSSRSPRKRRSWPLSSQIIIVLTVFCLYSLNSEQANAQDYRFETSAADTPCDQMAIFELQGASDGFNPTGMDFSAKGCSELAIPSEVGQASEAVTVIIAVKAPPKADTQTASTHVPQPSEADFQSLSLANTEVLTGEVSAQAQLEPEGRNTELVLNEIEARKDGVGELEVPSSLTELAGLMPQPGHNHASIKSSASDSEQGFRKKPQAKISAEAIEGMIERTLEADRVRGAEYAKEEKNIGYTSATIQLLDERSVPSQGVVYPVVGVKVRLIGTEFTAVSNALGQVFLSDLPVGSRFLLSIQGAGKGYVNQIAQISSDPDGVTHGTQITVLRDFTYQMTTKVAGVQVDEDSSSLCGTVYDSDLYVLSGISVSLDQQAEGPFYFNRFGYLDRSKRETGPNGRFCYFNIPRGPYAAEFGESDGEKTLVPLNSFANLHQEQDIVLGVKDYMRTRIAAVSTVYEQLGADRKTADQYRLVDMVDIQPFGASDPLAQIEEGLVQSASKLSFHGGRAFAVSQAPEFEPTVYSFNYQDSERARGIKSGEHVTPMIPRGFIEDMALYANVVYSPELGSVLIEHGKIKGQGEGASKIKLVDETGAEVGDGWYYSDEPVTKALFFNVEPGLYTVMVETADGYWLAADTVMVYSETASYVRLGARTLYH